MSNASLEQAVAYAALKQAYFAAARADAGETLARLLEAWAAVRDPALAEQIELSSRRAAELCPPVTDEAQWFSRTRHADSAELGRLLAKLPYRLSLSVPGLEALIERGPDPRISSELTRLRESLGERMPRALRTSQASLRHLCPAHLPRILALRERATQAQLQGELDAAIADHEAHARVRATKLDAAGLAWLRAVEHAALPGSTPPQEELGVELLATIAARPRELERRAVYADFLQQRGDVHGELIALQLRDEQGQLDPAGRVRVEALLEGHARRWLGNLDELLELDYLEFRAGFAARGELVGLDGDRVIGRREAQWLETHPGLATFEFLGGAPRTLLHALELP